MADDTDTLKSFLINLEFRVDEASLGKFNATVTQATTVVEVFAKKIDELPQRMMRGPGGRSLTQGSSQFSRAASNFINNAASASGMPGASALASLATGGVLGDMALGFGVIGTAMGLAAWQSVRVVNQFSQLSFAAQRMSTSITDLMAGTFAARQTG